MSDLISRQAAIESADKIIFRDDSGNNDVVKAMTAWKEFIKSLPSAQPEIIRCKDCKYFDPLTEDFDYNFCDAWAGGTNEDMFCGFAERRQDE